MEISIWIRWNMEVWDYKYGNLNILGIPSPKGDIDGSQVGHVFYVDKDMHMFPL
jgi:hypothetical protein